MKGDPRRTGSLDRLLKKPSGGVLSRPSPSTYYEYASGSDLRAALPDGFLSSLLTFYYSIAELCSSELQIFGDFMDERGFNLILFPEVALEEGVVADGIDEAGDAFGIVANEGKGFRFENNFLTAGDP